jgi:seryl-tRNA synthetase
MHGIGDRMRGAFSVGLGVEAMEGKAQGAGGITGADAHGLQYWGTMQRPCMAGGTGGAGDARLIEQDEHARCIHFRQAEGAGSMQSMRGAAMEAHFRQGGVDEVLKAISQGFKSRLGAVFQILAGELGGLAEGDDAGHVLRAAASFVLLSTTDEQRCEACALADIECSYALGRMHFVPAHTEKIDRRRLHVEVNFSHRLHRIRMHQRTGGMCQRDDFMHRREDAGFVVRPHDGNQCGDAGAQQSVQRLQIDPAIRMHWHGHDFATLRLPALGGFEDGRMLGAGDDEFRLLRPQGTHGGMHRIDGFGAAAGEYDFVRTCAEQGRDLCACLLDGAARTAASGMAGGGIAVVIAQIRQHHLQHCWIDRCGGVGIEVDHICKVGLRFPLSIALPALDKPRTPANLTALMLDIRLIRDNADQIKQRLAHRNGDFASLVDEVQSIDTQRRAAETERQKLQGDRNRISKEIGIAKKNGQDTSAIEAEVRGIGSRIEEIGREADIADTRQRDLLLSIPNLPHEACPVGSTAEENPEVRVWGTKPAYDFQPKDHTVLGAALGMLDFEAGAKISGSAFVVYRGAGARLERALISFLLDLHTTQHGYEEISPPLLVKSECLVGTGQLPKFGDQVYHSAADDLYLIPTAEVPVTNLHRDEILPLEKLPVNYAAYTPCFRREAGSAGLGTRGLIRMHQFDKVELVKITTPETSMAELESLTANAEKVLQLLGLHYRVIELCTGDIGFGSAKTYDIEVWAPGQGTYLEVSSCSTFGDYQARRMNLRYKDENGKNRFPHTLNGSGTALARLFVALVETYQQADGSILLPAALHAHFGSEKIG